MAKNNNTGNIEVVNIHKNHRKRMDERFKKTSFRGWSEYEVLEYLLYTTIKQGDTSPLAHRLLDRFGTLNNVFEADMDALMEIDGIGRETARHLAIQKELTAYCYVHNSEIPKKFNLETRSTIEYIKRQFFGQKTEMFIMICLDSTNRLIKTETLFEGTFDFTEINIPMLTRAVVGSNAAKVIFAHNHPSGSVQPSESDIATTKWLMQAMPLCGVIMLEHIIIAGSKANLIKRYIETGENYEENKKPLKMHSYNKGSN